MTARALSPHELNLDVIDELFSGVPRIVATSRPSGAGNPALVAFRTRMDELGEQGWPDVAMWAWWWLRNAVGAGGAPSSPTAQDIAKLHLTDANLAHAARVLWRLYQHGVATGAVEAARSAAALRMRARMRATRS